MYAHVTSLCAVSETNTVLAATAGAGPETRLEKQARSMSPAPAGQGERLGSSKRKGRPAEEGKQRSQCCHLHFTTTQRMNATNGQSESDQTQEGGWFPFWFVFKFLYHGKYKTHSEGWRQIRDPHHMLFMLFHP